MRLEGEEVARGGQCVAEGINFVVGVVEVETGAHSGVGTEQAHEGLGAMVACTNTDICLVENLAHVVRMNVLVRKTDGRTTD